VSRVLVAPVGTEPGEPGWTEVGHLDPADLEFAGDAVESFDMIRAWHGGALSFGLSVGPFDVFAPDVKVNGPSSRWVDYSYETPALPPEPVKRRRLTGKAYRIARRRYGRQVQAWERAGRPMVAHRLGFFAEVADAVSSPDGRSLSVQMRVVPPPGPVESRWFQHVDGPTPPGVVTWTP
jgi:hypothetical protein